MTAKRLNSVIVLNINTHVSLNVHTFMTSWRSLLHTVVSVKILWLNLI